MLHLDPAARIAAGSRLRIQGGLMIKPLLAIACCCAVLTGAVGHAQSPRPQPYKVVFDLTSDDALDHAAVLRWIREIASVNPETEMEIVMYGRGLGLVVPERSTRIDEVREAIGRPHVSFKVCEIAMKNQKIDKGQLLPKVVTVPDGIGEIVARQREGWGYIKVAH
jgi:uncharacterized protein